MSEGYVYAIENGDAVKIGYAKDPVRRLSELNVGFHGSLKLIGFVKGTRNHEKQMHLLAASERIRGEWFRKGKVISAFLDFIPKFEHSSSNQITYLRKNILRISQKELASLCNVSQATVCRWEQGTMDPKLSDLKKIRDKAAQGGIILDDSEFFADCENGVAA